VVDVERSVAPIPEWQSTTDCDPYKHSIGGYAIAYYCHALFIRVQDIVNRYRRLHNANMDGCAQQQHPTDPAMCPIDAPVRHIDEETEGSISCGEGVHERDLCKSNPCCAKCHIVDEVIGKEWSVD
jgi:hypothetical protein